jgi:membrane protein
VDRGTRTAAAERRDQRQDDRTEADERAVAQKVPGGQAETPGQIPARGWFQVLRRSVKEVGEDHLTLIAGGIAYMWFLALFPGMIAAVLIWGLVADPAQIQQQISDVAGSLPASAQPLVTDQLSSATSQAGSGAGIAVAISIALALWSASSGVAGLVEATNIAYDEREERNFFVKRGLALLMTLGFLVFLLIAFALVAVFPVVLEQVGGGTLVQVGAEVVRWALLVLVAVVALGLLYRVGPDRDGAQLRWLSLGAVIATVLWVAASVGFSFYVENFGSYGDTYGSLAGVVVLLLWFWITALVVLLGAEINAEAEAQTVRDTTTGDPRPLGDRGAVKADELPPGA